MAGEKTLEDEGDPLLHEIEVLEARRIADLALDLEQVRNGLLEEIREADLFQPRAARGPQDAAGNLALEDVLAAKPEFIALRAALAGLPRGILEKLAALVRIGRGDAGITGWEDTLEAAAVPKTDEIIATLLEEPNLHGYLRKGLYELGAGQVVGDTA